jgi:hypothetical protein
MGFPSDRSWSENLSCHLALLKSEHRQRFVFGFGVHIFLNFLNDPNGVLAEDSCQRGKVMQESERQVSFEHVTTRGRLFSLEPTVIWDGFQRCSLIRSRLQLLLDIALLRRSRNR